MILIEIFPKIRIYKCRMQNELHLDVILAMVSFKFLYHT